jgi:CBS-domain-containing membrane protein
VNYFSGSVTGGLGLGPRGHLWRGAGRPDYGRGMKISDVVRHKGDSVVTVRSDATVKDLLALLAEHKIGAIVVSDRRRLGRRHRQRA